MKCKRESSPSPSSSLTRQWKYDVFLSFRGTFKQAFIDHQKRFKDNIEKVETWRATLREVVDISGWHLQNRHEAEFIQDIVKEMMEKLSSKSSSITKNFAGMESTIAKMIPLYLGFENNVYMIGIHGMGGLGKTTLARIVYDEFHSHFEGSSFIANVGEDSQKYGLPRLQKQLLVDILKDKEINIRNVYGVDMIKKRLCHKKVLLVIDNVNHLDQLEKLAGEKNWLGNSMSIKLSPNWCNSRCMGFALCALIEARKDCCFGELDIKARDRALGDMHHSQYASKTFFAKLHLTDHIWILYLSRDDWFAIVGNDVCSQIEVVFFEYHSLFEKVQKCGFGLVYEQDKEESNQAITQCSSSRVITYEGWDGVHHGFDISTSSCDDYSDIEPKESDLFSYNGSKHGLAHVP
uniref:ADP-ribosyl cyclase/cyclic ADP-ribose hydrolase n=1 Tax=Quercus lobata TaxID=97700 RepID=A0A7N2MI78_QUELO